jgi:PKD repeat protein
MAQSRRLDPSMSEPSDELTPLPEQPPESRSRLTRSPYVSLGVAAVVVSTVFATVAALSASRDDEQAAPKPESRGTIESTTYDPDTTDPTTTSSEPGKPSKKKTTSSTTTTTDEETTEDETTTEDSQDEDTGGNSPKPPTGGGDNPPPPDDPPDETTPPPVNKAPVADFSISCEYLDCTFDGGSSSDPDGSISGYEWSIGGTAVTASKTYGGAGTYQVTLTVTDNDGKSTPVTKSVTVEEKPPPPDTTTSGD